MTAFLTIKVTQHQAGLGSMPDPWGREFIYRATTKGITSSGDDWREAVENLIVELKANPKTREKL